jgi:hypothetical protein
MRRGYLPGGLGDWDRHFGVCLKLLKLVIEMLQDTNEEQTLEEDLRAFNTAYPKQLCRRQKLQCTHPTNALRHMNTLSDSQLSLSTFLFLPS